MSATVGELDVRLNLELSRLDTQITAANKKIANMGRRMNSDISRAARSINTALSTLGIGVGVGALTAFGKSVLDLGGKINDLSMQAGISTDAFQTLAAVGKESGVSGEQIAQAFTRMGSTIQEAAEGSKEAADSLRKLGLSAAGLKALKPEEQFEALAIKIATATDKAEAYNAALEILGSKTAPKLREVLARLGTDGFDKLSESTASVRFSPEQIKTLDDAGDKLQRISDVLRIFSAKKFLDMADAASRMAKRISESKLDALAVAAAGPMAWYLYSKETVSEQAARGGGSTRNPSLSRSPDRTQANADQAALLERMRLAEEAALQIEIDQSNELSRQRTIMQEVLYQEELREKSRASGLAILKEQTELEKAQIEYAERFGPDYSAIKEVDDALPVPDLKDFERFQDQVFQIFDNVGDRAASTFADMVLTGENAFDSLVDVVARSMLEMVARLAIINPIMNAVFGLGGAGTGTTALATLGSVFGGGKASGGSVSGGMSYLVGEKGPEIFSPNTSGAIIPNHKLGMGGGGTVNSYSIDARGASVDAVRELRQMMASLSASVEPRAVAAVRDSDRRRK